MTATGSEELAVVVAAARAIELDSLTSVLVASVEDSADGDDVVTDEEPVVAASLPEGVTPDAAADDEAMVDDSTEVAGARVSTVKELPIDTSTATPGAVSLVSPAVLANTTAAWIGSLGTAATDGAVPPAVTAWVGVASGAGVDELKAEVLGVFELTAVGGMLAPTSGADDVGTRGT